MRRTRLGQVLTGCLVATTPWLHGCTGQAPSGQGTIAQTSAKPDKSDERTCLVRAMYFEFEPLEPRRTHGRRHRGHELRTSSPRFPNTICGVVGQRSQFADGVLTNSLDPRQLPRVERAADAILAGERYKPIGDAMWFHVASLRIFLPRAIHGGRRRQCFLPQDGPALRRYPLRASQRGRACPSERQPGRWPRRRRKTWWSASSATATRAHPPRRIALLRQRAWARSLSPARTRPPAASTTLDAKKPPGISPRRLSSHYGANQLVEEGTRFLAFSMRALGALRRT